MAIAWDQMRCGQPPMASDSRPTLASPLQSAEPHYWPTSWRVWSEPGGRAIKYKISSIKCKARRAGGLESRLCTADVEEEMRNMLVINPAKIEITVTSTCRGSEGH